MHMADALVSPAVAGVTAVATATLFGIGAYKVKKNLSHQLVPLMGVMGAFIFAAQMVNFAIPGTGASGHIVGGVLLAAVLGPWAGFITLTSVLVIQCLLFADGGLMALGANILNMGAFTCLIAYPLIYKPLMRYPASLGRIMGVSVLTCVVGLELSALAVSVETVASGVTALPFGRFLLFMLPIHLLIGIGEGLATAGVLFYIQRYQPEILSLQLPQDLSSVPKVKMGKVIAVFSLLALVLGVAFYGIASSKPDGLEWSISRAAKEEVLPAQPADSKILFQDLQSATALMPDYNVSLSGVIGGLLVLLLTWGILKWITYRKKSKRTAPEK